MEIHSDSIPAGSVIALRYAATGAGGANVSPALRWSPGPAGTASYTVTCFDPDAPTGSGWWHWVVTDIPAEITALAEDAPLPAGARSWPNDAGDRGWGGPWPPPGPAHRYQFRVYAVGVARLDVPDAATSAVARLTLGFDVLETAEFTALFANPAS